jgi:hypothetical protein
MHLVVVVVVVFRSAVTRSERERQKRKHHKIDPNIHQKDCITCTDHHIIIRRPPTGCLCVVVWFCGSRVSVLAHLLSRSSQPSIHLQWSIFNSPHIAQLNALKTHRK